jgi:putative sterol carrier protein
VTIPTPQQYYAEQVPAQFNRLLEEQEQAVAGAAAEAEHARRVLDGMRDVTATIRVDVQGEGGGTWFLNIRKGRMAAGDAAEQAPFLTMIQDAGSYQRLVQEAGDSALGMLGGLSGLAGEMKLTRARIDNLAGVNGSLQFTLSGDAGFTLLTHFGSGPVAEQPTTSIRVDPEGYRKLRAGEVQAHEAFMSGLIQVEGDMQLAMQLALAALSPD